MSPLESEFWKARSRFLKPDLITEALHPSSVHLSSLAQNNLDAAYHLLMDLDLQVIDQLQGIKTELLALRQEVVLALQKKARIILVGCGASGRIAAQCEHDWRVMYPHDANLIESVLAGGDVSLIEALESFEDSPHYACLQMQELDLKTDDLVIGLSASGESPFILSALEYAENKVKRPPYLICANPLSLLLQRNPNHLLGKSGFRGLALNAGPMALTGSTRMQATTLMTLALMQVLFSPRLNLISWEKCYQNLNRSQLSALTLWEAQQYQQGYGVVYEVSPSLAMSVLADMTERAPTFNTPKLLHVLHPGILWQGIILKGTHTAKQAWEVLLQRRPRCLNEKTLPKTTLSYLEGFDLSEQGLRQYKRSARALKMLRITWNEDVLAFYFDEQEILLDVKGLGAIEIQLLLRLILVNHSTLVMGRLGYYHGNLMTSVRPANFKLIDRAIRFILYLAQNEAGQSLTYEDVAHALFEALPTLKEGESIVMRLLSHFHVYISKLPEGDQIVM